MRSAAWPSSWYQPETHSLGTTTSKSRLKASKAV